MILIVEQSHFCPVKCNTALFFRLRMLCKEEMHACMLATVHHDMLVHT